MEMYYLDEICFGLDLYEKKKKRFQCPTMIYERKTTLMYTFFVFFNTVFSLCDIESGKNESFICIP